MIGQVVAGSAVITLAWNSDQLFSSLDKILDETKSRIRQAGLVAAATGATITASLAAAASQAERSAAKIRNVEVVLGDSAGRARELASAINNELGLSIASVTDKLMAFTQRGEEIGLLRDQALSLAETIVRLGADLDRALGRSGSAELLQQAIHGSADAAYKLGLNLSDAAVAAEFGRPIEQMTEIQIAATRAALAQQQLQEAGVAGSASADALAAAQGRASESFWRLVDVVGNAAAPGIEWFNNVLAGVLDIGTRVIDWTADFISENQSVVEVVANVAGALMAVGGVLGTIGASVIGFVGSIGLMVAKSFLLKAALGYIPIIGPAILKVMAAIKTAIVVVGGVGAAAAASFAAIGVAVGAAAYGVYRLHKATGILNPALRAMGQIGTWLKGIWDAIAESIGGVVGYLMKLLGLGGSGGKGSSGSGRPSRNSSSGGGSGAGLELTEAQRAQEKITEEMKQFAERAKDSIKTPQQRFEEMASALDEAAKKGLLTPDEYSKLMDKAKSELDEALQAEWEASEAGKRDKMLADFGKSLAAEVMTLEEEVAGKIQLINDALAAGKISEQTAQRAIDAENQKLQQAQQDAINKAADMQASLARARGKAGETDAKKIEQQRIDDLRAAGATEEAVQREIAMLGEIVRNADQTIASAKPSADVMSTRSATEAMFGLTGPGIDKEQLELAKQAERDRQAALDRLDAIARELEG